MAPQGSAARGAGLTPAPTASRVGRDGTLALRFERRGDRSVLAGCRWRLPLQVLAPLALDDAVGAGAHACLTTPSATKVYRTAVGPAEQAVRLTLAPGARLEWVPDHTIPFAGAALRQRVEAEVS